MFFTVKQSNKTKQQNSTESSEDEKLHTSSLRLINSQQLTPSMAVIYLHKWGKNTKLLHALLTRIRSFCKQSFQELPTIVYILSRLSDYSFDDFYAQISRQSYSQYLIIKWAINTYVFGDLNELQLTNNKLDSSLLRTYKANNTNEIYEEDELHRQIRLKEEISNYICTVDDFYLALFRIPERLKTYQKDLRPKKLKSYLKKLQILGNNVSPEYGGVALPINKQCPIILKIHQNYCSPFSTKDRVPIKLVVQTINRTDISLIANNNFSDSCNMSENNSQLIFPQSYFGRLWKEQCKEMRKQSLYRNIPSYKIRSYLVKSGDDIRQEYLAMKLIRILERVSIQENIKLWVRPYDIIPYRKDSGLIEFIEDTRTISYLKEASGQRSLKRIFSQLFGQNLEAAIMNFISSLLGYSLLQYLFQIKDRHNNNILIDKNGHIIHIDFSFILSCSPGNINFERAPFKFTDEYLEILEGKDSDMFRHFKISFFLALKYIGKHYQEFIDTIQMMINCEGLSFQGGYDKNELKQRFCLGLTDEQLEQRVEQILDAAICSYTTTHYDKYQWLTNEIYS